MATADSKCCKRCGESKLMAEFPLCRGRPRARCKRCHTADATAWAQKNADAYKERLREWHRLNKQPRHMGPPLPAHIRIERMRASGRRYRASNPEKNKASQAKWAAANKHVQMEVVRRRQASKIRATPLWASKSAMQEIYRQSVEVTRALGVPHDVDHMVPLQSPFVCGFHCEANLQVLPRKDNRVKHNNHWPDMWL